MTFCATDQSRWDTTFRGKIAACKNIMLGFYPTPAPLPANSGDALRFDRLKPQRLAKPEQPTKARKVNEKATKGDY